MPVWLQVTLPIVAGLILALIGVIWTQLNAKIDREKDALWNQIGRSSQEGMRRTLHDVANTAQIVESLADRMERLETWRNGHR